MKNFVFIFLILTSCGYGFSNLKNPFLKDGVNSVSVPIFNNNTFEKDIEIFFTNALRTELNSRNSELKYKASDADAILKGVVKSVTIKPAGKIFGTTSTENNEGLPNRRVLATSYIITASINVQLLVKQEKVLWSNNFSKAISFNSGSYTDADNQVTNVLIKSNAKLDAIKDLSETIMQAVVDSLLSDL